MTTHNSYNYIAISIRNVNSIKIGETGRDIKQRKKELQKKGYIIVKTFDKTTNRAERLLIESGLRITLLKKENTQILKDDYFIASMDVIMDIIENFNNYCEHWLKCSQ
jgi:hypothetical protein